MAASQRALRIVCFGDSLTEGVDGASYLEILRQWQAETPLLRDFDLINAGLGGNTVENLLRRAERDVTPLQPDWVVVFVGANDFTTWLLASTFPYLLARGTRRFFHEQMGILQPITPERYRAGLRALVDQLMQTGARVAICTPTPRGNAVGSRTWRMMERYVTAARQVAAERECVLLDLYTPFSRAVRALPRRSLRARLRAILAERYDRRRYGVEELAQLYEFVLTYDGVHFSQRGATIVAQVLYPWLLTLAPVS